MFDVYQQKNKNRSTVYSLFVEYTSLLSGTSEWDMFIFNEMINH